MAELDQLFDSASAIITSRLAAIRAAFHHAGMKGESVESSVSDVFQDLLPANIGIASGIAIDKNGNESRQLDLILYDRAKTPVLFRVGRQHLIPIECIYFAVEVKTNLSLPEFRKCEENCDSFKALKREAYYNDLGPIVHKKLFFGKPYPVWQSIFLIIALESPDIETVSAWLEGHRNSDREISRQIDSIFCFDQGLVSNAQLMPRRSIEVDLLPTENSLVSHYASSALKVFLVLFSRYYNQVDLGANFDFTQYHDLGKLVSFTRSTERQKSLLDAANRNGWDDSWSGEGT